MPGGQFRESKRTKTKCAWDMIGVSNIVCLAGHSAIRQLTLAPDYGQLTPEKWWLYVLSAKEVFVWCLGVKYMNVNFSL